MRDCLSSENTSQKVTAGEKLYGRHGIDSAGWRVRIGAAG
jgi:hypothetical protein